MIQSFCLWPSAKDQGFTWVVLVVLVLLLVHFLFKRNLSEKKSPWLGIKPGSFRSSAKHLFTEQQSRRYYWSENWFLYLAADLGSVLVDTCFVYHHHLKQGRRQLNLTFFHSSQLLPRFLGLLATFFLPPLRAALGFEPTSRHCTRLGPLKDAPPTELVQRHGKPLSTLLFYLDARNDCSNQAKCTNYWGPGGRATISLLLSGPFLEFLQQTESWPKKKLHVVIARKTFASRFN